MDTEKKKKGSMNLILRCFRTIISMSVVKRKAGALTLKMENRTQIVNTLEHFTRAQKTCSNHIKLRRLI